MRINEMVTAVHETAKAKGWWREDRNPLELHMLVVSEIAEATEEVRKGTDPIYQRAATDPGYRTPAMKECWNPQIKPEGEAIELADAVIRIMDIFGRKGWDLEETIRIKTEYNKTRPERHGGKRH